MMKTNMRSKATLWITAWVATLLFCSRVIAENSNPLWENVPTDISEIPPLVDGETVFSSEEGSEGSVSTMSLTVPESLDAEIVALANALGEGSAAAGENAASKAVRLFNWVRNNIDYEHYYGLKKGAALTLLEGSGNDFDQSALLADLLVAAGYSASNVKLRLRAQVVDYGDLMSWVGLAEEPYPGKTFQQAFGSPITTFFPNGLDNGVGDVVAKQAVFAAALLRTRGTAYGDDNSGARIYIASFPGKASVAFNRMFVQLTVGGVTYDLDPSYKVYEKVDSSTNLLDACGYDRSALLTAAGGSGNADSTSGLNQTNVGTYLTARTTQLLDQLNSGLSGVTLAELVNGRRIVRQDISSLAEAFPLAKLFDTTTPGANKTFNSASDSGLANYKTAVRFQTTGMNYSIPTSDLKGRKITLTFSNNTVELRLDDGAPVATANVTASSFALTNTVTHPGSMTTTQSETGTYRKNNAFAYTILYGFTPSGRMLQKRYDQLRVYLNEGKPDNSREVRTELLNIMGLSWLHQTELCSRLIASKNHVLSLAHHRFGRMAQEEGFYVDVGLQLSGSCPDDANTTDSEASARFGNLFHAGSLFASAMEHGIIEQMQPGSSAVSTVNILRKANSTSGNALYLATSSNWANVSPNLTGYSQAQKTEFGTLIGQGAQLFLPKNFSVSQGNWSGSGWVIRSPSRAGMIINGGYNGGYSTASSSVSSSPINTSQTFNPSATYTTASSPLYTLGTGMTPSFYGSDPVNMATGAFVYAAEDMAVGLESAPRGLAFSRHYSSILSDRNEQNMGYGWTHNLHIRAEARTASDEALGIGSPQQAAAFLVALAATEDLYRSSATPKEWGVAALVTGWFVDQMRNNAVSVRMGKDVFQFVAQPDGSYTPPPASTMTLGKTTNSTYFLQQRLGNTIHFDTEGKATKIVDVDGREMTFAYNTSTNLDYVQDHVGRRFTFGYDGNKRITSVTDSTTPSRSVTFGYDTNSNLITATDPEGKVAHFDYAVAGDPGGTLASEHRIVRLRNDDGETITQNVYDSLGRIERQFLHGDTNKTFHLYYTGRDNFEVNPQGDATHYYYDERGRATGSRDAEGNLTSMTYDSQDRIVSRTSGAGETTAYTYDASHNITRIDHPRGGGSTLLEYDSLNRLDLVTDPNGAQTDYVYFSSGNDAGKDRPQSVTHAKDTADQSATAFTYIQSGAAIGCVATITDGDGLVTTKTYDGNGHPDVTTAPGGFVTDQNYDARGNLLSETDPRGKTTTGAYNKRRQVTSTVADSGGIAATADAAYDNQARRATVTAPAHNGGQRTQAGTTYSPTDKVRLGKLNGVTVAETTYDSRDWAASAKDAASRTTAFLRRANGDLREAQRPGSRTMVFDYDGDHRLIGTTNPGANSGARVEEFAYDTTSGGLPRTVKTEADGLTVTREYDAKGQLRFLKDRKGATFEFRYDDLGRRTHVIVPGGATTVTVYTKNGRVASVTEPSGDTATFSYDATTGRLGSVAYSGGATVNYTSYDANGNLLALDENGSNEITRTYDGLNRVTSYTEGGNTIGYRYYPDGKLAKLIYPGGTESGTGHVEYLYNAEGRLWQVVDKLDSTASPRITTYSWNADGSLASITRPNGTVRTITYDSAGRPSAISESAGSTSLLAFGITYYPSDEIATLDITPAPPIRKTKAIPAVSMTFDDANRVAMFNGPNLLAEAEEPPPGGGVTPPPVGPDGQEVDHDADGNMTWGPLPATGTMRSYSYDTRNRLTSAGGLTYTYNAEGNRVGIGGTETTSLVVDPQGALPKVLVRTKDGVTTRYVYGVGLQYEVSSAGAATYYHYDQSGNTAMLTDQAAAVVDRVTYASYGTIRYRMGNFDTPFLYGGFFGVMTDSNGLVCMRARYYNPLTKRFITSDPAMDGLNWYAYADGNPINFADPTGLGASSVLSALNSSLNYLGMVGSGFVSGLGQGLDNFNNTVTFGLYDQMGWSNSATNTGWEHDLSRSLATIPRDIVIGAGISAAYQGIARAATGVVNSLAAKSGVGLVDDAARAPVGRLGSPMKVPSPQNTPTVINGRSYTGHALDQMQGRGLTPSVIEDTLARGAQTAGRDGAKIFTTDQARVIVNPNGSIKTVYPQ